jgi:formate dehydrogenase
VVGRPTLVQNVETVYWLREILEGGADAFAGAGRNGRKGIRLFSVSGRVQRPGVYRAANGITVRQLIEEYAGGMLPGHELYAYLPGGASGGILPAALADEPLDFDVLARHGSFIGSAAVIVLSQHDSARAAARNVMNFFAHESCGKCTPCRAGTAKSLQLMSADHWDTALLGDLGTAMADASICGLGQAAPNPVRCVQTFFPHELS